MNGDAMELRECLRHELTVRLTPAGWSPVDLGADPLFCLATFICPMGDDFAATAEVVCGSSTAVRVGPVLVGVSYDPLRRLWPLLGERFRFAVLHEDARGAGVEETDEEDDERRPRPRWGGRPETRRLEVAKRGQAAAAADEVAGLILDHGLVFAQPLASIDALVSELADDEEPDFVDGRVPALLAAAGRFDEARDALTRYRQCCERGSGEWEFARQLERWIDSDGNPALVPSDPRLERFARVQFPSLSVLWREARDSQEAVDAVGRAAGGKDRGELRSMLEQELARRGLSESPLWIEQTLDHLGASRTNQALRAAQTLKTLGQIGLGVVKVMRGGKIPDMSKPDWLAPPDHAAYAVPRDPVRERWTAVQLDPAAFEWLDRVHAALPNWSGSTRNPDAWLQWETGDGEEKKLAVHIGAHRVGTLDEVSTKTFGPVMDAAARRDQLPYTTARLTRRSDIEYLLELQLATTSDRP